MRTPRRWRLTAQRRTMVLGAGALTATAAVFGIELARVWRRGFAPLPAEGGHLLEAGREATLETLAVFRQGYRATSPRENAVFNMFVAFALTFGLTRAVTHLIRARGELGPIKNLIVGERHVHHFIPGLVIAFLAGGISIGVRHEELDKWFALPFGAGVALVLDESALLLSLEDVYWSEEGILSLQITFAAVAILATLALALRLLKRGESSVLDAAAEGAGDGALTDES